MSGYDLAINAVYIGFQPLQSLTKSKVFCNIEALFAGGWSPRLVGEESPDTN